MGLRVIGGRNTRAVFLGAGNAGSNNNDYTFNLPMGEAWPRKHIIFVFYGGNLLGGLPNTPPTIGIVGGVTAARIMNESATRQMWIAPYTLGGSADIFVQSVDADMTFGHVCAWAAYDLKSATPLDTDISGGNPASDVTLSMQSGGFVIAHGQQTSAGVPTFSWSGVTADAASTVGGATASQVRYSAATANKLPGTSRVVGMSTGSPSSFITASFR